MPSKGKGEEVFPLEQQFNDEIIIYNPGIIMLTKDVFVNNKIVSEKSNITTFSLDLVENDLEPSAFELNSELKVIKSFLVNLNCKKVVMSGSGSSFVILCDRKEKRNIYKKIKRKIKIEKRGFVCYGN